MNPGGTIKSYFKISSTQGGFSGILKNVDYFGYAVSNLGDLYGDGTSDIAVGARNDDDGGLNKGAV